MKIAHISCTLEKKIFFLCHTVIYFVRICIIKHRTMGNKNNYIQMMVSKDIYRLILVVVLSICGMYAYAQEPSGNSTKVSSVRQQIVGHWNPDRLG